MKLFGAVAWRANKQDTVTTSSTEAELLALSQTAKEAIYISRLLQAFTLQLNERTHDPVRQFANYTAVGPRKRPVADET